MHSWPSCSLPSWLLWYFCTYLPPPFPWPPWHTMSPYLRIYEHSKQLVDGSITLPMTLTYSQTKTHILREEPLLLSNIAGPFLVCLHQSFSCSSYLPQSLSSLASYWLPGILHGYCWSLIFSGYLHLFSLGWRPHHSLLGTIPLSSGTPISSLLSFIYLLLLCRLTTFSDTSLIPHLPGYFMPYFFHDKISQRMYILSPVHSSVLSEGSDPLKLLHTTKDNHAVGCNLTPHSVYTWFWRRLGSLKILFSLSSPTQTGHDNCCLPSSSRRTGNAFSFIKNRFFCAIYFDYGILPFPSTLPNSS